MERSLSDIFPPSSRSFYDEVSRILAVLTEQTKRQTDLISKLHMELDGKIDDVECKETELQAMIQQYQLSLNDSNFLLTDVCNKIEDMQKLLLEVAEAFSEIKTRQEELEQKNNTIIGGISGLFAKDFPIDVCFEREYYKQFPLSCSPETIDFKDKFLSLIDGLDEDSVETVVLALNRLNIVRNTLDQRIALYSTDDQAKYREIIDHFYSNIFEISKSCYFYRGYLLPINHFEPCVFWDKCGITNLERVESLKERDVIDAGAFIGDSALILAPLTKQNVYAFEPIPSNYELLLKTIEMNSLTNVVPCQCALGAEKSTAIFAVGGGNGCSSTQFLRDGINYYDEIETYIITLDEFVKDNNLDVGLIKADVEGAEQLLLQGAIETLKTQRPSLLISIYHNASDFFHIKPMLESLNLGYKFKIRHPVGGSIMTEMLLIAEVR